MVGQRELMAIIRGKEREADVDERVAGLESPFLASGMYLFSGDSVYAAADIAGGLIFRDPNGGDRTDTTDDADALITECALTEDGMYADCILYNDADAAEAITLAGGSGVTIVNPEQLVQEKRAATLTLIRTGEANVVIYVRGGGA
jgi:hypothetical protein